MKNNSEDINKEDGKSTSASNIQNAQIDLERITKIAAFLFGTLYVFGILIVNTYLFSLGISEFSLFKVRYIYTGALALLPIFLSTIMVFFGTTIDLFFMDSKHKFLKLLGWLGWLGSMFFVFYCLVFLIYFQSTLYELGNAPFTEIYQSLIFYILSISIAFGIFYIMMTKKIFSKVNKGHESDFSQSKFKLLQSQSFFVLVLSMGITSILFFYVPFFSNRVLPNIPEQFGGLKPKFVRFIITEKNNINLNQLGIHTIPDSNLSNEMKLLFETESQYVVRSFDSNVVCIDKKIVDGLIIMK